MLIAEPDAALVFSVAFVNALLLAHGVVTWTLVGLIWTVQVVHYPLWSQMSGEEFRVYHARHMLRITVLITPLVTLEFFTAAGLIAMGNRNPWLLGSLVPMVTNWISTFLAQAPLHLRLARGFDPELHRRLVTLNWWRTAGWTIRGGCVAFAMLDK